MQLTSARDFGQLVRQVRKAQGLTQPQLAGVCGLGTRFVVDLERGKPTCQLDKTLLVVTMLGIRLEALSQDLHEEEDDE